MDTNEIHERLLKMLDETYGQIRAMHEDRELIHPGSNKYRGALDEFERISNIIFSLKEIENEHGLD